MNRLTVVAALVQACREYPLRHFDEIISYAKVLLEDFGSRYKHDSPGRILYLLIKQRVIYRTDQDTLVVTDRSRQYPFPTHPSRERNLLEFFV